MPNTEPGKQPLSEDQSGFSFYKGNEDILSTGRAKAFDWNRAASIVREHLTNALNAKHVAFLLGSGCSSVIKDDKQVGIQTMKPMALAWVGAIGQKGEEFLTQDEVNVLKNSFGLDISQEKFSHNLERLMEVLYSLQCALAHSTHKALKGGGACPLCSWARLANNCS